jgi:hypothetical protein
MFPQDFLEFMGDKDEKDLIVPNCECSKNNLGEIETLICRISEISFTKLNRSGWYGGWYNYGEEICNENGLVNTIWKIIGDIDCSIPQVLCAGPAVIYMNIESTSPDYQKCICQLCECCFEGKIITIALNFKSLLRRIQNHTIFNENTIYDDFNKLLILMECKENDDFIFNLLPLDILKIIFKFVNDF